MFSFRVDRLLKSTSSRQNVNVGEIFRRVRRGNIVETAKVLDIAPDSMGVPHVHYEVSIRGGEQHCFEEQRTLGLACFAERFTKVIPG